jgi:hypothetical protein
LRERAGDSAPMLWRPSDSTTGRGMSGNSRTG